jgi:hypothetical protein
VRTVAIRNAADWPSVADKNVGPRITWPLWGIF